MASIRKILAGLIFIFFFQLYTSHIPLAQAAFIDPGWGTRGAGKGGAFVATADDASSILWNPATLSQVFMRESMLSYNKPYAGLEGINMYMGHLAVVFPVSGIANFGMSASMYDNNSEYKENIYLFSVAKEFALGMSGYEPMMVSGGINIKYLTHKYIWDEELLALNDPITAQDSAGAVTLDLGILVLPRYELPIGICAKNIIPADVGLVSEDIVPLEASIGVAYRLGSVGKFEEVTPEVKIGYRNREYGNKFDYAAGIETWLGLHTVGLRLGCNNNEAALGVSFEKYIGNIGFRIDYAALLSLVLSDNFGSHRVSTTVKF